MLKELLLREPCIRSSASSDRLDCESNEENLGDLFIRESCCSLWITLTDWNCGILGRAPVEFKELVVADFEGDCVEFEPLLTGFAFAILVLLWLWFSVLLVEVSLRRKCLNENGFSLGASAVCLKSLKQHDKYMTNCTITFLYFTNVSAASSFSTVVASFPTVRVQFILVLVFVSHRSCVITSNFRVPRIAKWK